MTLELIYPDWPAPANVGACSTTRSGGVSKGAWASLNLAQHVGDDPEAVAENRRRLRSELALRAEPNWLEQVHGIQVKSAGSGGSCADACTADEPHGICVVMTADCLPVLFCNRDGTRVAAAHAGWRGLQAGVLEQTASRFDGDPDDVIAWLGPAIGPDRFEVGSEVREAFMASHQSARDHLGHRHGKVTGWPTCTGWRACGYVRWVSPGSVAGSTVPPAIQAASSPIVAMALPAEWRAWFG
jgi:YfiH family protein